MTIVILVRHAHSTANAEHILAGRSEGVHLSAHGRKQATKLAKRLGATEVKAVRLSPLERCKETIDPWVRSRLGAFPKLQFDDGLLEVDYGIWTGEKLRKLSKDPLWKTIQEKPSRVTFPKGESLRSVQDRAMQVVESSIKTRGKGAVLLVSHGDVLKSVVAASLNLHLDDFQRIVIDPASVSILDFSGTKARLLLLNDSSSKLNLTSNTSRPKGPLVGGGAGPTDRRR